MDRRKALKMSVASIVPAIAFTAKSTESAGQSIQILLTPTPVPTEVPTPTVSPLQNDQYTDATYGWSVSWDESKWNSDKIPNAEGVTLSRENAPEGSIRVFILNFRGSPTDNFNPSSYSDAELLRDAYVSDRGLVPYTGADGTPLIGVENEWSYIAMEFKYRDPIGRHFTESRYMAFRQIPDQEDCIIFQAQAANSEFLNLHIEEALAIRDAIEF